MTWTPDPLTGEPFIHLGHGQGDLRESQWVTDEDLLEVIVCWSPGCQEEATESSDFCEIHQPEPQQIDGTSEDAQ